MDYYLFLLQAVVNADPVATAPWWQTSSGTAIIVAILSVVVAPLIKSWFENRRRVRQTTGHLTDTSLTLGAQERREAVEKMEALHEREISLFKQQLKEKDGACARQLITARVTEFEARQRAHAYGSECQRLQAQLYRLQMDAARKGVEVPDFTFRTYPEIMAGIDDKVVEYQEKLEQELMIRNPEGL